jgi:4-hydroxy-3-polyprenylbenzoate decarboxylase
MAKNNRDVPSGVTAAGDIGSLPAYRDLRQWLAEAERLGEVTVVKGLDTDAEIGMAAEVVMASDAANCIVFDDIKGHAPGWRVLINFFGGTRKNMTLGFANGLDKVELSQAFYQRRIKDLVPVPPEIVETGPVMDNVQEGEGVDLTKFPAPIWHPDDGGRYIGTGSYSVTMDPESGRLNAGNYRVMVHDRKTVGCYISPGMQGRVHRDKHFARGEKMPMVVVLGGDPLTFLAAGGEGPEGGSAYDFAGGMRGEAIRVIRGRHTGLPFPADAEIVLEGFVDPGDRRAEGPFGEWTGYYGAGTGPEPVMHVEAVYHRDDPVILGCPPQHPPDEMSRYRAITRSAMLRDEIEKAGVPDVVAAWAHEIGNSRLLLAVSIKPRYPGHSKQAGHVAAMCHAGAYAGRYVVVTDDDVDVTDLQELTWAMLTRSDPATSIDIVKDAWSTPLDPRIPPWEKEKGNLTNSRAIIDACRPYHWRDQYPLVNAPSPDIARKARERFGYLLDREDPP